MNKIGVYPLHRSTLEKMKRMNAIIGIGEYLKKDYPEILSISEDRDNMDDSWEKWKANKNEAIKNFKKMGMKTIDIIVVPKELVKYCRENGLPINGKSRASYVSYQATEKNKK